MASPTQFDQLEGVAWLNQVESVLGRKLTAVEVVGGIYCSICHATYRDKKEYDSHYVDHSIAIADIGYTCIVCHKEFTSYPSFRNHCYLAHVTKNKHKCTHCFKTFSKQSILNSHISATHCFKCIPCNKQFPTKKELHTHQIIHKNDKDKPPYQCYGCGEAIESIDMCEFHIDEHCTSLYTCPICSEPSNNKLDAAKHLTKHFGEALTEEDITAPTMGEDCSIDILGGVLCIYCDELFKNRIEFDTHFATEHGDKERFYSCNICGNHYDKYSLFSGHCYDHIARGKFKCTDCDKTFPRLSLLVVHTEAFHASGSADKPFSCGDCGHVFHSTRRLWEHTKMVHDTTAMRCHQKGCEKTFGSLLELMLHQREHRTQLDNWCRQCGLQFTALAAAERHLDVHRKKNYTCPVCQRVYHEKYLLLNHIPQHFESVLHVCKVCGKAFNRRHRLVQHSKTHSDLRSHKCTYCQKGFIKASHLEQHLNIHTGFKPFTCIVCSKTFGSRPNWNKHMRKVHNIDRQVIKNAKKSQKIQTIAVTEAPPVTIVDNSDNKSKIESGIDSTSSEMSLEAYSFAESDDSTMDSIDPTIIEKDWCITNLNSYMDNSLEYTELLPVDSTSFDSEVPFGSAMSAPPREYGPEFNVAPEACGGAVIHLGEPALPHVDPRLAAPWEPRLTRLYDDDLARLISSDIY